VILPVAIPGAAVVLAGLVVVFLLELAIWPLFRLLAQNANPPKTFWWT
jgi:hypothetical protein